jgi:uncharacterized protein (TIGR00251 family)
MIELTANAHGTIVPVHAQPAAKQTALLGERAGSLRIAVTAPPEKGKANAAVKAALAQLIGCRFSQIALVSGETSRQKRFLVMEIEPEEVRRRLEAYFPDPGPPRTPPGSTHGH